MGLLSWFFSKNRDRSTDPEKPLPKMFPSDPQLATDRVMEAIRLFARNRRQSDVEIKEALIRKGIESLDAELLVMLVPSGLARSWLREKGLKDFLLTYCVFDQKREMLVFSLASESYYVRACEIGDAFISRRNTSGMSDSDFQSIVDRSSEKNSYDKVISQHGHQDSWAGTTIGPIALLGVSAEVLIENGRREHSLFNWS